ncbi:MAG: caspase family protein [Planctomycetaceae bacterium]|jgi:hypothetical protein|nr:caspase family protein [Planctomycetaceae bacterium]
MSNQYPDIRLLQSIIKNAFESRTPTSDHPVDDADLLLRWADQQLSETEHAGLLDHLARCSDCRQSVSEMINNGILEFRERLAEPSPLIFVRQNNLFRYSASFLGVLMTSTVCLLLCLVVLQTTPDSTQVATNTAHKTDPVVKLRGGTDDEPDKFALLIGINRYGKLKESEWLDGCHNDIAELKSVIIDRFMFDHNNVITLLDEQATAAGIREQMQHLSKKIQSRSQEAKPAQVLFYFSGHGSRVPDSAGEDGFGSSLVVYDSEQQGSGVDIPSAELNKFSHEICADGKAELLIVLDSCHSGGGARGITKFRGLTRSNERPAIVDPHAPKLPPRTLPEGLVFLSACQSHQKEPEYEVDGKMYGLFTYHLTQLLRTEQIISSLNYATLKDVIHRSYQRNKISQAPTPTVEGNVQALRKPVFGADRSIDHKPYWEVKREGKERDTVRMEAGKVNGITEQSLFELYQTAEQTLDPTAPSLGWFRITKVDGQFSLGTFFQWKDENRSGQIDAVLSNDFTVGYAVERYHDHGDNVLAVRVVNADSGVTMTPHDPAIPETMRSALSGVGLQNESSWIRWTGENETCDLVVKYDAKTKLATVFPATGGADDDRELPKTRGSIEIPDPLRGGWGPVEWGTQKGKTELIDIFRRVMKVLLLERLVAEKSNPVKTRGEAASPPLTLTVVRCDADGENPQTIDMKPENGIILEGGEDDWYQLRVHNNDIKPLYITVLCVDPDKEITPLAFGPEGHLQQFNPNVGTNNNREANRLEPGSTFVSPQFGFEEPYGAHSLIVLATREPSDFSYLSQSGLEKTRSMKGRTSQIFDFIEDQCHLGTRGIKQPPVPRDDSWSIGSIEVISKPAE